MNKLDTSAISAGIGFPIKSGTLDFLQLANHEGISATIESLIGTIYNTSTVYILSGCSLSVVGANTIISPGYIYYNGELYLCDGQSFLNPSGGDVVVCNLVITQYIINADPVVFTDTLPRNVHNIRKAVFAAGATGTGSLSTTSASDFDNITAFGVWRTVGINVGTGWALGGTYIPRYMVEFGSKIRMTGNIYTTSPSPSPFIMVLSGFFASLGINNFVTAVVYDPAGIPQYRSIPFCYGGTGGNTLFTFSNVSDLPTSINCSLFLDAFNFKID